jgi:hypothetical protein
MFNGAHNNCYNDECYVTNNLTIGGVNITADPSAIASALEALSSIGSNGVTVTGSGPYAITFTGPNGAVSQPLITATDPAISIAHTTVGGQSGSNTLMFTASATPQTIEYTPTQAGTLILTLTDTASAYSGGPLSISCGAFPMGTKVTTGGYPIYSTFVNDAGTVPLTVVPGVPGKKVIVMSYLVSTGTNGAMVFFSSSGGAALTASKTLPADSSVARPMDDFGYFATMPGEGLVLNASATGVGLDIMFAVA